MRRQQQGERRALKTSGLREGAGGTVRGPDLGVHGQGVSWTRAWLSLRCLWGFSIEMPWGQLDSRLWRAVCSREGGWGLLAKREVNLWEWEKAQGSVWHEKRWVSRTELGTLALEGHLGKTSWKGTSEGPKEAEGELKPQGGSLSIYGMNECVHECGGKDWIFPGHWIHWFSAEDPQSRLLFPPKDILALTSLLPSGHPFPREPGWDYCLCIKLETQKSKNNSSISHKIDFTPKTIIRDKQHYFIMIKGWIHQEDIITVNIYTPNIGPCKYIK